MPTAAPETGETGLDPDGLNQKARESGAVAVRLGQVGYLRFQKFVEVIYTPVVSSDPATDDLDFYSEVEADLTVEGVDASLAGAQPSPEEEEPHFENTYRSSLLNYEEGRRFRVKDRAPADPFSSLSTPAPQDSLSAAAAATTAVYRVFVKTNGIYRLTWSYLLDPATGVAPGLSGTLPSAFKMTTQGVEIPIRVVDGGDGTFGPGDYIEFYGEGMLAEPKLVVNFDFDPNISPGAEDIQQGNDFTDENVYYLFGESGAHARIPNLAGAYAGGALEGGFLDTVRNEFDNIFVSDGRNDPFYQSPGISSSANAFNPDPNTANCGYTNTNGAHKLANYMGPGTDPNFLSVACAACNLQSIPPLDPNSSTFSATVRVRMRGSSRETANPDHMTVLQVGTATPTSRSSTMCWDGEFVVTQSVSVPQSSLTSGVGPGIYVGQPGLTTTTGAESFFMDYIEVDYRRALRLTGSSLQAHFPNAARNYEMGGFPNSVAADLVIYDISRTVAGSSVPSPRLVTGGTSLPDGFGGFAVRLTLPLDTGLGAGVQQRFSAAGTGGFRTPLRVTEVVNPADLTSVTNAADMIVITTPAVVGAPAVSQFDDYVAHRAADSALNVKVVMMRDIYDQFSFGIETPEAIRSFLAYALDNWRGPSATSAAPAYVMLVGDSSLDYKNVLNLSAWVNEVPTFIMYWPGPVLDYYASDNYLAAIRGSDQLPDIHLGRVTIRTPAEAVNVFQKMLDYDLAPPAGTWRSTGLLLADRGNPNTGETTEFMAFQNSLATNFFSAPFTNKKLYYALPPYNGEDPNTRNAPLWRSDYVAEADSGAALTSYVGHGSFDDWGLDGLFTSANIPLFSASQKPTVLVNENCLVGGFHSRAFDALGENVLKAPGKGAIAVFAPAGLSSGNVFTQINNSLYGSMFGLTKERRLGNLITNIRVALAFSVPDMQGYVLLGDPAMRMILPAPRPPGSFAAANGQDARVTLSWTPSPDAGALTRIYRKEPFDVVYTLLTPSGVAGTSYADTAVVNGKAYFYRAVAVDPSGPFEGAVTNMNNTCNVINPPASGTDCVWARPSNPNPPSIPSNFKVVNPGTGDRLRVSWSTAIEPDVAHYTVHYGTASQSYGNTTQITAPATGGEVSGLLTGQIYFMVVTATNTSGKTSLATPEGFGIPRVFEGVTPPDIIADLEVLRSVPFPDSIELRWTRPTNDIYGGPTSIGSYALYRDTFATFVPSTGNRIAVLNNAATTVYTDPGAFSAPQNFFYLVSSSDTSGFASGLGHQLPNGISDLTLTVSGPNLSMTWTPVTLDIDGAPTQIEHYELYADVQPVGRSRLPSLAPANPFILGPPLSIPMPAGTIVYYNIIAVDVRQNKSPF